VQGSSTPRINIFLSIIYFLQNSLLQKERINSRNYSNRELIMEIFV
jgi:hypothetical protein